MKYECIHCHQELADIGVFSASHAKPVSSTIYMLDGSQTGDIGSAAGLLNLIVPAERNPFCPHCNRRPYQRDLLFWLASVCHWSLLLSSVIWVITLVAGFALAKGALIMGAVGGFVTCFVFARVIESLTKNRVLKRSRLQM